MSKLALNLDDLQVDSFAADEAASAPGGTVHGQAEKSVDICAFTQQPDCGTDGLATLCIASCGGTCIEDGCGILSQDYPCI
jgi:hypothetical protein